MKFLIFVICVLIHTVKSSAIALEAYPSLETMACNVRAGEQKLQKKIIDITHVLRPDMPSFGDSMPLADFLTLVTSAKTEGEICNLSELKLSVHSGTHVDAPGHFVDEMYDAGMDVDSLDLDVLVGPVLIVDTPRDSNITAQVMQGLNIPRGVERVIFRTANTDKGLMYQPKFDSTFIGFTKDGAEWLVAHTDIKLVGTDYFSVAVFDDQVGPHVTFLRNKVILVEALKLDSVDVGLSALYCLPLRILKAEGAPARCILIN